MATSGSYNWTSTRNEIIQAAFRKMGRLGDFESITDVANTAKLNAGIAAINPMIKAFANKGMPVWAISEQLLSFTPWASTKTVSIGPGATINQLVKPLKILQAVRVDNSNPTTPTNVQLEIYTYQNYENLSSPLSPGTPTTIFYQPLNYTGEISLWPLPSAYWQTNGQLYIRYQRQFQDFDSATDEPDFPVEWHEALIYSLAARLAPEYSVPMPDRQMLKQEAQAAVDDALSFETEEGSLFLMPDRWRK